MERSENPKPDPATRSLSGKVVCVTGAGRGIGKAIAEYAAQAGASVVVVDLGVDVEGGGDSSSTPAREVCATIRAAGGAAVHACHDVATEGGASAIVECAIGAFGRIDGMVCCAGNLSHGVVQELPTEQWERTIGVHLSGQFHCTAAAARAMLAQGEPGRIVHFSSAAALIAPEFQPHYSAAKAGVMAFSRSCARALGPSGITVNCVLPGASTRMTEKIWSDNPTRRTDTIGLSLSAEDAVGTWRDPANVAPFVIHLLGDGAARINGQAFALVGYQVTLVEPARYGPTIRSDGPWATDDLSRQVAESFPSLDGPAESSWPPA